MRQRARLGLQGAVYHLLNTVIGGFYEFRVNSIVNGKENAKISYGFRKQCNSCSGKDEVCKNGNGFTAPCGAIARKRTERSLVHLLQSRKYRCGKMASRNPCSMPKFEANSRRTGHSFSSDSNYKPNGHGQSCVLQPHYNLDASVA